MRLVVPNPVKKPEPPPPAEPQVPRITKLLALAREWQAMLDRGEVSTRATLAELAGLSPVRVSQVLGLLRLHPAILAHIEGLPVGMRDEYLTERWLRRVARLEYPKQLEAVAERVGWLPPGPRLQTLAVSDRELPG